MEMTLLEGSTYYGNVLKTKKTRFILIHVCTVDAGVLLTIQLWVKGEAELEQMLF
jgi:hypothetical protein